MIKCGYILIISQVEISWKYVFIKITTQILFIRTSLAFSNSFIYHYALNLKHYSTTLQNVFHHYVVVEIRELISLQRRVLKTMHLIYTCNKFENKLAMINHIMASQHIKHLNLWFWFCKDNGIIMSSSLVTVNAIHV